MNSNNETDVKVAELLKEWGVRYHVVLAQVDHERDDWKCDKWSVMFDGEHFEYHTGTGHRISPFVKGFNKLIDARLALIGEMRRDVVRDTNELMRNPVKNVSWHRKEGYAKTMPPTQAGVLYALVLDSESGRGCTFREFCGEFGYDDDSLKARDIYDACQKIAEQMSNVFTHAQLEELRELLQDY